MPASPYYISFLVTRTFFRVYRKHEHKHIQRVIWVCNIQHICIRPVEQFLGYRRYRCAICVNYGIVPFKEISFHVPAVEVYIIARGKKRKLLAYAAEKFISCIQFKRGQERKNPFLDSAYFIAAWVEYLQAMAPRKLALYLVCRFARFIVYVITVEPGEETLFE